MWFFFCNFYELSFWGRRLAISGLSTFDALSPPRPRNFKYLRRNGKGDLRFPLIIDFGSQVLQLILLSIHRKSVKKKGAGGKSLMLVRLEGNQTCEKD